ncbi:mycofactocin-coupled SDR family oxidoreductase [Pseudonocardia sp. NPDC049154]|uniref:mycofactocin-coupled SDR family oxidoreductase n=1 Tax=Pseudonocardia sp. NPDC049154 TaxID=3155501 RepID=UPI0033C74876
MSGRVQGKVAFVTGAARGQGRAHALRLAQEGADIIAVDLCQGIDSVDYRLGSEADLKETARQVEALDRRVVTAQADVRDPGAVRTALDVGVGELGRLDIVVANAGILSAGPTDQLAESAWRDMIDVSLSGAYYTARAAVPHLRAGGAGGAGGAIILTSSALGIRAMAYLPHYVAAKAGVIGLMRSMALELAPEKIRVNTINPSIVDSPMIHNPATNSMFLPGAENPSRDEASAVFATLNPMPTPWIDSNDVSNAVLFLASDEARYVTGLEMKIDAGFCLA